MWWFLWDSEGGWHNEGNREGMRWWNQEKRRGNWCQIWYRISSKFNGILLSRFCLKHSRFVFYAYFLFFFFFSQYFSIELQIWTCIIMYCNFFPIMALISLFSHLALINIWISNWINGDSNINGLPFILMPN